MRYNTEDVTFTRVSLFQFGDRLQQFGQRFGLPPGITRLVQGFWLLDHGDFEVRPLCGYWFLCQETGHTLESQQGDDSVPAMFLMLSDKLT